MARRTTSFSSLYLAYSISTIGDRLWTFAIIFVLEYLGGIRLVGINQLVESVSSMLLSTYVGNWLDRHDRKRGALTVLAVNNLSVAISAGLLAVCLTLHSMSVVYGCFLTLSIFFCALSKCASDGEKLAFTKDWIVVMAKREEGNTLSLRNATMTTIDQFSSVIAPLLTGYVMLWIDHRNACFLFVMWNLVSWLAEAYLLKKVYHDVNELAVRERKQNGRQKRTAADQPAQERSCMAKDALKMITSYWRQSVFAAAFGLALLYMTVLGFDGLAVGYGKSQGLTEDCLGVFRAAGSVFGLAGAFAYTFVERNIGLKKAGFLGLVCQQIFLYLCVVSVFLAGSPFSPGEYFSTLTFESWWETFQSAFTVTSPQSAIAALNATMESLPESSVAQGIDWKTMTVNGQPILSVFVFLCGITFARFGLWMADLSITQIMQESIPETERGTVFGVQTAMCQLFSVLKDVTVIILPDPKTFGLLILISIGFVTCGFISYVIFVIKDRKPNDKVVEGTATELEPLKKEIEDV